MVDEVCDVGGVACRKVVNRGDTIAPRYKKISGVRTYKARPAGDEVSHLGDSWEAFHSNSASQTLTIKGDGNAVPRAGFAGRSIP